MPRLLELFSGTGSVGRAFAELGWEVVSLDLDPKAGSTICADVCSWEPMPMFAPGYFDMIWASPPCTEYSRALTRRPRKLEEGDRTAIRTLELIRDLRPRFWCIENPQTGLLKRRPFMANLQWSDVTYCKYGFAYKKATRLWHNLPWEPQHGPCCARSRCALSQANGGRHPSAAQRGTFRRRGEVVQNCHSQGQLYSIPEALCREIASVVNAHVVTRPAAS